MDIRIVNTAALFADFGEGAHGEAGLLSLSPSGSCAVGRPLSRKMLAEHLET